jgi:hypothetical protein
MSYRKITVHNSSLKKTTGLSFFTSEFSIDAFVWLMACLAKYLILSQDIFACYLVQSDIEYEVIDLLQDRVPKSVCARHYFNPSLEYRDKK